MKLIYGGKEREVWGIKIIQQILENVSLFFFLTFFLVFKIFWKVFLR